MDSKEKSALQESLTTLYLRLNGYFTTGFIVHSEEKKISGEVDIISVRFPYHKQDDTEHNSSDFLEISPNIDIIIAEVKSKGQSLRFNDCLRIKGKDSLDSIQKILLWIGILENNKIYELSHEIYELIQTKVNSQLKTFRSTKPIKTNFGEVRIRPILFSPERQTINNADKFVTWIEINSFIWDCICPDETKPRPMCGTRYDFNAWGKGLDEIVKIYKDRQKSQKMFQNIEEFYNDIDEIRKLVFVEQCRTFGINKN